MTQRSLRVAAGFAVLSAVTTFLLWLLPRLYAAPQSFEEAVSLHQNPYYMARLWVNFIHIFFALIAYGAAAWVLHRAAPALAGFGYVWFVLWGFTELLGVTVNIFAVNRTWRPAFTGATPEQQAAIRTHIEAFAAIWDAMFFLLLIAFLFATLCYGLAAIKTGDTLGRWVGILFLLAVPLTIGITIDGYTQVRIFSTALSATYPVLQPVSRALLGVWLWRRAA